MCLESGTFRWESHGVRFISAFCRCWTRAEGADALVDASTRCCRIAVARLDVNPKRTTCLDVSFSAT